MVIINLPWFQLLLSSLCIGIIIYILLCLFLLFYQNRLIFLPSSNLEITPDEIGLVYEDVWINVTSKKGEDEQIHGWWLPHYTANSPVLLYLHGNGKNISANLGRAQFYLQQGFEVFLIDYRGYGRSRGRFPNETRVYEDAHLAYNYLVKTRMIKPESIFLYGHSLGGAIAIDLAVNQPKISGIIVESTFTSIQDVAEAARLYRLFPLNLIVRQKFNSIYKINRLKSPLLVIHGTEDTTVPAWMSQVLYEQVKVPKQLLLVNGAEHNNVRTVGEEKYLETLDNFLNLVKPSEILINHSLRD